MHRTIPRPRGSTTKKATTKPRIRRDIQLKERRTDRAYITLYVRQDAGPLWDWAKEISNGNLSTFIADLLREKKAKVDKEDEEAESLLQELE